jgi:hypothetical protein
MTMRAGGSKRRLVGAIAVLGVALVAMPVVFQMFDRAPKGATMISSFRPDMTNARLGGYQAELREINAAVSEAPAVAGRLFGSPGAGAQKRLDLRFADFAQFELQWRVIDRSMSGMITTIRANLGNYEAVAALPSFTLFPWFFVLPGLIVAGLIALAVARPARWRPVRWVLVALGVGLALSPAFFQMFSRAPAGGRMMTAFRTIETNARVQQIQGYFGEMSVGQGAVQLELLPALRRSGLSAADLATRYPGLERFDGQWVHILNDMTPMIGVMSDNVVNYEAVAALPAFALFPWFFVIPGALLAGLALTAGTSLPPRGRLDPASELSNSPTEGVR